MKEKENYNFFVVRKNAENICLTLANRGKRNAFIMKDTKDPKIPMSVCSPHCMTYEPPLPVFDICPMLRWKIDLVHFV